MKIKKVFAICLIIALLATTNCFCVFAEINGDGTKESPYLISNYEELKEFRNKVNGTETQAFARLTSDIDVSSESNWSQIGTGTAYTGTFDGNGYKITGFSITNGNNAGLFKSVGAGTIKNLTICGNVTAGDMSAGFVGNPSADTVITNCMFIGNVKSTWARVSGISRKGTITNCGFIGDVSGTSEISGMGLEANASNCFVYGKIEAIAGNAFTVSNVNNGNCFYLNIYGRDGIYGFGTKKSEEEFASGELAFILGKAFGQKIGTDLYPVFRTEDNVVYFYDQKYTNEKPENYDEEDDDDEDTEGITDGDGSVENPYIISSASKLSDFVKKVNGGENSACAVLTSNINAGNIGTWKPIGSKDVPYKGTFNGNGFSIKGIGVYDGTNIGTFGYVKDATVMNLNVYGNIKGFQYVGGIAGYATGSTVFKNCHSGANVEIVNSGATCGGICGICESTVVFENCFTTGNVTGRNEVSGICLYGKMKNCYVYGNITANENLWLITASKERENCYYLSGCANAGGLLDTGGGNPKTKSQFESGEVTYLLGSAYGQIIGTDLFPMINNVDNSVSRGDIGYYNTYATPVVEKTEFIGADNFVNADASNVSRYTKEIKVYFNGRITEESLTNNVSLQTTDLKPVAFEGSLSENGKVYTLKLKDELKETNHLLKINNSIVNFMGNSLSDDYVLNINIHDKDEILLTDCKITSNSKILTDLNSIGENISVEISLINPYPTEKSLTIAIIGYNEENGFSKASYVAYKPIQISKEETGKIELIKEKLTFDNNKKYDFVKVFVLSYPIQRNLYTLKINQ